MSWELEYTTQKNGNTFYRYREQDTVIWFEQDDENGNAFYCYVSNEDKLLKHIDFYTKGGNVSYASVLPLSWRRYQITKRLCASKYNFSKSRSGKRKHSKVFDNRETL